MGPSSDGLVSGRKETMAYDDSEATVSEDGTDAPAESYVRRWRRRCPELDMFGDNVTDSLP